MRNAAPALSQFAWFPRPVGGREEGARPEGEGLMEESIAAGEAVLQLHQSRHLSGVPAHPRNLSVRQGSMPLETVVVVVAVLVVVVVVPKILMLVGRWAKLKAVCAVVAVSALQRMLPVILVVAAAVMTPPLAFSRQLTVR